MCGIVGFISKKSDEVNAKRYFMKHALALDTLRGRDSTGTYTVTDKNKVKMRHSIKEGIDYVTTKSFKDTQLGVWAAVGHNRAATAGEVNRENAHPFCFGDVTMVHNGTLTNDGSNLETYDYNLPVDSMQICKALAEATPEEADKVLSQIDGSFALVWYDRRDKTMNMARNNSRPLHYTYNQKKDHLWFMSDGTHLSIINKGFHGFSVGGGAIYALKAFRHLKFTQGSLLPSMTEFEEYKRPKLPASSNSSRTGSLKNAAKRWQDTIRKQHDKAEIREEINGKKRRVPEPMYALLKQLFGLSPDSFMEFLPYQKTLTSEKKYMVVGEVVIPEWGGCDWPATIYNVPMVQAEAYKDHTWLVNPVGVTHPTDDDKKSFAQNLLCHLVHCNYDAWKADNEEQEKEDEKREEDEVDLMVPGPEGRMIRQSALKKLAMQGCIQCSDTIEDKDLYRSVIVNNGQDLMCEDCVDDVSSGLVAPYGHVNRSFMH